MVLDLASTFIDDVTSSACPFVVDRLSDRSVVSRWTEEAAQSEGRRLQSERIVPKSLRINAIRSVENFHGSHVSYNINVGIQILIFYFF